MIDLDPSTANDVRHKHHDLLAIAIVFVLHLALIVPIAWRSGPNCDELAHLASGLYHWQTGKFDAYRVNPPLYRMWCTLPIAISNPDLEWHTAPRHEAFRSEWCLSAQLLNSTSPHTLRCYLITARLTGLPFVILGGVASYFWAYHRYGGFAALATLILWTFSPNVLSWGATLCPDIAGAAIGICASFALSRWLVRDDWITTAGCGILQGLCILTKSTWILLFITTPMIMGCAVVYCRSRRIARSVRGVVLVAISVLVVNFGYGWEHAGRPLGKFDFQSQLFRSIQYQIRDGYSTWPVNDLPVPLPANLVIGIDQQRREFEQGKLSYRLGTWSSRGWYTYYLVCAALKVPLGLWLLVMWIPVNRLLGGHSTLPRLDTLALWIPLICVATFVCSQNGFSRHFRYIFPCLPFVFIIAGQAARVVSRVNAFRFVGITSLFWFAASSVSTWPFCHSYFNELAGGPRQGFRFLLDSNVDWGEDVLWAEQWLEQNPAAEPVYRGFVTDEFAAHRGRSWRQEPADLSPGWYLISVHRVMDPSDRFSIMRRFHPIDCIGFSTLVYHLKADDIRKAAVAPVTE